MKKLIITFMLIISSMLTTSCTEEQVEAVGTVLTLTYLYNAVYSHNYHGTYYYRTRSCSTHHVYYSDGYQVNAYCRYYSAPDGYGSGYYITTNTRYTTFQVYGR